MPGSLPQMIHRASLGSFDWLWLAAASVLLVGLCAALPARSWLSGSCIDRSAHVPGALAGICVEVGRNAAGRLQAGLWWEAFEASMAIPRVPTAPDLHVFCGIYPWSTALPLRGTFIH